MAVRQKLATQVETDLLAQMKELAQQEGRQIQFLFEEAIRDLLEKRRQTKLREPVMRKYEESVAEYGALYDKLARWEPI